MSKVELDPVQSGYSLSKINDNFRKIEDELNKKVLYRGNPVGEPNEMDNDLDMNGNHIYNLPKPVRKHEPLRLADIGLLPEEIKEYADEAKEYYERLLEALASGSTYIGDYGPGLVIEEYTDFFGRDGIWWRPSPDLELPYTTTGVWDDEENLFVAVGDQALRQELKSTDDPGRGAGMVGYSPSEEYEEDTIGGGLQSAMQSVKRVGSSYRDKNDLKDLGVNGTLLEGGGFPRSMSDELSDNYSGNNPELVLTSQAPVDLAQCSFVPSNEISSNFVHSNFPWMSIGGTMKRLMAVDIRTNLFNSPVNIPIFKPTRTNGSGILSFRYIGDKPIHTVIQGSLNLLVRSSLVSDEAYSRVILRMGSSGHPHLEEGQNGGTRSLGVSLGGFREPFYIENYKEFNDLCFPIDQNALDNAALHPNLYVGSDNGFFSSNYAPDTEDLATADGDGPVGPEVRTTKWMDVGSYVQNRRRFLMDFTGTSTRTRVQYKDEEGNISIYAAMDSQGGSRRIYRIPHNAKFARIYYSGRGDTVDESSIEFRPLGPETSSEYDPLGGVWTERIIPVHRDIVLWPGVEYWFDLSTSAYEGASSREWGYRVQSGGLSFLFDSGGVRKNIATTFWEK